MTVETARGRVGHGASVRTGSATRNGHGAKRIIARRGMRRAAPGAGFRSPPHAAMEEVVDRLETMRVFVAVAEARGFAAGARRLAMSPPAVTRAVAALEKRLGVALLGRSTRTVKLTEAGERFLVDAKRILADLAEVESVAAGSQTELRGSLTVTAPVLFGRMFVAPIVLELLDRHPHVRARVALLDRVVGLLDEGVDVAVRIATLPEGSTDTAHRVGQVRRVVVAAPAYLARHGRPETLEQLAQHDAVVFSHGPAVPEWSFVVSGKPALVRPRARLLVSSTELSIAAAVAGAGVTHALSYQVAADVRAGRLEVLLAPFERPPTPVHVVSREGRRAPARVRAFVELAVARLRAETELRRTL